MDKDEKIDKIANQVEQLQYDLIESVKKFVRAEASNYKYRVMIRDCIKTFQKAFDNKACWKQDVAQMVSFLEEELREEKEQLLKENVVEDQCNG